MQYPLKFRLIKVACGLQNHEIFLVQSVSRSSAVRICLEHATSVLVQDPGANTKVDIYPSLEPAQLSSYFNITIIKYPTRASLMLSFHTLHIPTTLNSTIRVLDYDDYVPAPYSSYACYIPHQRLGFNRPCTVLCEQYKL
jgi:hypothetical protein